MMARVRVMCRAGSVLLGAVMIVASQAACSFDTTVADSGPRDGRAQDGAPRDAPADHPADAGQRQDGDGPPRDAPGVDAPDADGPKADAAEGDTARPDAVKADTVKHDTGKPDALKPDALKPDALKLDAPPPPALGVVWYGGSGVGCVDSEVAIAGGGWCASGFLLSSQRSAGSQYQWEVKCSDGSSGLSYVACASVLGSTVTGGPCPGAFPDLLGVECGCTYPNDVMSYGPSSTTAWTCSCASSAPPSVNRGLCSNTSSTITWKVGAEVSAGDTISTAPCGSGKVVSGGCVAPAEVGIKASRPEPAPGILPLQPAGWRCEFGTGCDFINNKLCYAVALCYQ